MKFADDMDAILFLEKQGYTLTLKFCWVLPKRGHEPDERENAALDYLFNEWDYGGVIGIDIVTESKNDTLDTAALPPGRIDPDHREVGSGPWGRDFVSGVQPDARPSDNGDTDGEASQQTSPPWDAFPKVG